jgi:hypothetical protein
MSETGAKIVVEWTLVLKLTRELRNANGIERTPDQVKQWLDENVKRPNTFIKKLMDDPDSLLQLAEQMRSPYIDNAPPSSEWE